MAKRIYLVTNSDTHVTQRPRLVRAHSQGMIDLARRSGQIVSLDARAVYDGDQFECALGLDPTITHKPDWQNPARTDPERLRFVYAVAKLKDGGTQFEVMSRAEVEAIRARSQGYKMAAAKLDEGKRADNPWISDFQAMALKTVIRRLFKYLPVSIELQTAAALDERAEAGLSQNTASVIDGEIHFVDDDAPTPTAASDADPATGETTPPPKQPMTVAERIASTNKLEDLMTLDEEVRAMADGNNKQKLDAAIRARFEVLTNAKEA